MKQQGGFGFHPVLCNLVVRFGSPVGGDGELHM